jgi:hypothetical protein
MVDNRAFRPLWSEKVIDEAQRALERLHPDGDPNRFRSRFRSMNEAFDDALVTSWETLAASTTLPDRVCENPNHLNRCTPTTSRTQVNCARFVRRTSPDQPAAV